MVQPGVERITVAITQEMAHLVRDVVRSGEYASASEVVRDALRLWTEHQKARARQVEELRQRWREGLESGPAEEGALVLARLRQRYEGTGGTS
jgi:antitoxin ParD1/3/4